MKANRKFKEDGEAVSAVIGVILMVAITVAIAATVYVYVSGMLAPTSTGKTMSAIRVQTNANTVTYKVTSTDSGILWASVTNATLKSDGTSYGSGTGEMVWVNGTGDEPSVGSTFTVAYKDAGTYITDLIFNEHIVWTSPSVTAE